MLASSPPNPAATGVLPVVLEWALPAAALVAIVAAYLFLRHRLLGRLRGHAAKTSARWDDLLVDLLASLRTWLLLPPLIYAAAHVLVPPLWLDKALHILAVTCLAVQTLLTLKVVIDAGINELVRRSNRGGDGYNAGLSSSVTVIRVMLLGVAAALVALAALDNMNVSVTPMLTGLGIGGVAVALAVQSILSDLFGSLTIILDKPFVVGDYIVVGRQEGTVEQIGIKTTRVRALSGEQLVFSNSDLLSSRVQNFKRMQQRRVAYTFSVAASTPTEKIRRVPEIVQRQFENQGTARLERCTMTIVSDTYLGFEIVYTMLKPDSGEYMEFQQEMVIGMIDGLRREDIALGARPAALPA